MLRFIAQRILMMIPTIIVVSIISFVIIQLPPGDWLTTYVASLEAEGEEVDEATLAALRSRYGLGQPTYVQYFKWVRGILRGDFGHSFAWNAPVADLIWDRLLLTVILLLSTLLLTWAIAFPVGICSAVRKYSIGDYFVTALGFPGHGYPELSPGPGADGDRLCVL